MVPPPPLCVYMYAQYIHTAPTYSTYMQYLLPIHTYTCLLKVCSVSDGSLLDSAGTTACLLCSGTGGLTLIMSHRKHRITNTSSSTLATEALHCCIILKNKTRVCNTGSVRSSYLLGSYNDDADDDDNDNKLLQMCLPLLLSALSLLCHTYTCIFYGCLLTLHMNCVELCTCFIAICYR